MAKTDFTLEFIKENQGLRRLAETLVTKPAFALDIETIEWWNRQREQVALIQLAFRQGAEAKVAVVDALAPLDFEILRPPLEAGSITKIIHNAAFDAPRLAKYYNFEVAPVHDTMRAARFNGERKYSLKAQAAAHLRLSLDKTAQRGDWSRRPLESRQLYYAALDAYAAFLLYENQTARRLAGDYRLKKQVSSQQVSLPLDDEPETKKLFDFSADPAAQTVSGNELTGISTALLGIVAELPTRYSPDSLAVSLGGERVGLAGWIIDRRLGRDADLDEETVKLAVADLCERNLLKITEMRRLEATAEGFALWRDLKGN